MTLSNLRSSLLFLLLLSATPFLDAQGLLIEDEAYNAMPRQADLGSNGSKAVDRLLEDTPKSDLRPYCPRPQHQGAIGSCTGWSTGYGAMSILQAMEKGWAGKTDTITKYAHSALYVYNQIKIGSCMSGSYISRAVELVKREGNLHSSAFDRFKNDCERMPTDADSLAALPYKIKDYVTLFGTKEPAAAKIQKTRLSLAQKLPVLIGMMLRKNFETCTADPPYWTPDAGDTTFLGAHAMVVVGYDDGRQAFEIMNSWGEHWGNGGFIWVKYADFGRFCTYAIQMLPKAALPDNTEMISAGFTAQTPFYDANDVLQTRPDPYQWRGDHYEPTFGAKVSGALQQWQIPRLSAGTYLYVFSQDAKRNINLHWPRDGSLDDKFEGSKESARIPVADPGLYLPDEYGALRFRETGTEHLCFLLSRSPLPNLNDWLRRLQDKRDGRSFAERLQSILGERYLPPNRADFAKDQVAVTAALGEEEVLPILVRLEVR